MRTISSNLKGNWHISDAIEIQNDGSIVIQVSVRGTANIKMERSIDTNEEIWCPCGTFASGESIQEKTITGLKKGQKLRLLFPLGAEGINGDNVPQKIYVLD